MCVKLFPDPPPLSVTSRPSGVAGGTGRLQFPLLLSCETLLWLSVRGGDFRDFCLGRGRKFVAGKNDERSIIISKSVFFFSSSPSSSLRPPRDSRDSSWLWKHGGSLLKSFIEQC